MSANLDTHVNCFRPKRSASPNGVDRANEINIEQFRCTHHHGAALSVDIHDVARCTVFRRYRQIQPATLPNRDGERSAVLAQNCSSFCVGDIAWLLSKFSHKVPGRIAVRNETNIVAIGLLGGNQPAFFGFGSNLHLRVCSEREQGMCQLLLCEYTEHI